MLGVSTLVFKLPWVHISEGSERCHESHIILVQKPELINTYTYRAVKVHCFLDLLIYGLTKCFICVESESVLRCVAESVCCL